MGQRTRFDYRQNFKVFYHWLEFNKLITKDAFPWPKMKPGEARRRFLEAPDLTRLMSACQDLKEKCVVFALFDSKCRSSELISMTRENLWPDHALVDGKTGPREVSLSPELYVMLCRLSRRGLIFTQGGRRMSRYQIYRIVHNVALRAGLKGKKLGPHILRHSAAVQHLVAGGDLESLRQELGHTNIEMTAHYAELSTVHVRDKHQALGLLARVANGSMKMPTPQPGTAAAAPYSRPADPVAPPVPVAAVTAAPPSLVLTLPAAGEFDHLRREAMTVTIHSGKPKRSASGSSDKVRQLTMTI